MPDLGPVVSGVAELVGPLVRALLRTTLGMILFTIFLAVMAYKIVAPAGSPMQSAIAVLIVLALGAVLGGMLAVKRAVLTALRQGVQRMKLGERTVGALFTRIFSLPGAQAVRVLPLDKAEALLRDAVAGLYKEGGVSGFLRVRLHNALVERIETITLSRFRAEGEKAGGIDLNKVRDELSVKSDELLCNVFDKALTKITVLILLALGVASLLVAVLLRKM